MFHDSSGMVYSLNKLIYLFYSHSYAPLCAWPAVYNFPRHALPRSVLSSLESKEHPTEPTWSKMMEVVYDDVTNMTLFVARFFMVFT